MKPKKNHPWRTWDPGSLSSKRLPQGDRPIKGSKKSNRS